MALVIGAVAGVALTLTGWGALAGAVVLAVSELVARARQRPGQIPALWSRIVMSGALTAPLGWLVGLTGLRPILVGVVFGLLAGLFGIRPQKVALGPIVGLAVGWALAAFPAAVVATATVVAFRCLSALIF